MMPAAPLPPEQAIDRAIALREAGAWGEAAALLHAALAARPDNPRLWQTLGTVERAAERSAAANAAFGRAAALVPDDPRAAHGVAQASLEAGRPAVGLFDRAHALSPGDGAILLGRAAAQLAEGRGDEAIAALDAITAANPLWLEGQATLARLRWQLGDADGFDAGYVRALASHPAAAALWHAHVSLLVQLERYADAAAAAGQAERRLGPAPWLTQVAALTASELGDTARADALFATLASSADPGIVERHARHLLRTGRADDAARRIDPHLMGAGARGGADRLWPYAALAWRLTGDSRHDWLAGDPGLISVSDLDLGDPAALADRLRGLHRAVRDPLGQSVRGGTQTDGPLFANEAIEIQHVRAAVLDAVARHVAALGTADAAHPTRAHIGKRHRFAGSWSVRLTGAGHHSNHIHPLGWLSSALYVAVPTQPQMGPAPAGWLQLGQPPAELGIALDPLRLVEPRPGRLVLFPSWMWHGTAPIAGGERLSIAFDVAAIG